MRLWMLAMVAPAVPCRTCGADRCMIWNSVSWKCNMERGRKNIDFGNEFISMHVEVQHALKKYIIWCKLLTMEDMGPTVTGRTPTISIGTKLKETLYIINKMSYAHLWNLAMVVPAVKCRTCGAVKCMIRNSVSCKMYWPQRMKHIN